MPHALHLGRIFLGVVPPVTRRDVLGVVILGGLRALLVIDENHASSPIEGIDPIQPKRVTSNTKIQKLFCVYTCPLSSAKATFGGAPLFRSNRSSKSLP